MNDKNPIDLGKDYLKYVKDESIKGNSKKIAPGVFTIGAGGILANRFVGRKLEEMNKEQKMQMYEDTKKEFIEEYKNDPQLLEIMLKNLDDRTFGKVEEKADGGRIGLKGGADASTFNNPNKSVNVSSSGSVTTSNKAPSGPDDRSNSQQNQNHREAMRNYQRPTESKIKKAIDVGSEASFLRNLYKLDPIGLGLNIGGKMLYNKFIGDQSSLPTEEENTGIMQMAELNDMQKKMLEGPQKNLKDIMGISNEEILENIKPFDSPDTPATIEDVNKFYAASGGRAGLKGGGADFEMSNSDKEFEAYKNYLMNEGMIQGDRQLRDQMEKHKKKLMEKRYGIAVADGGRIGLKKGSGITSKIVNALGGKNITAGELGLEGLNQIYQLLQMPGLYADGGRIGLKAGMTKRAFLKLMGSVGLGVGAAKSGIFTGLGKGAGKTVAKEVAQQTTSSMPPPYFFKLAEKIKKMGDDVTATTDRTISKSLKSKDGNAEYILEENMVSGDTIIKKVNKEGDDMITDVQIMEYRMGEPVKTVDGKVVTTPNEYEEVTEVNKRIYKDDYNASDYTDGIEEIELKKIIDEVDDQAPSIKYASGGLAYMLGE